MGERFFFFAMVGERSHAFLFFLSFILMLYVLDCEPLDEMEGEDKRRLREA